MNPDIREEAHALMRGETRVEDIRALTQAFIAQRLQNSQTMESTKSQALRLLATRLSDEEEASKISIHRLMEIIGMISEMTSADVTNMVAAFAAKAGTAPGGAAAPTFNILFGSAPSADADGGASDRVVGAKSTYQLLDALDSVAQQVIAGRARPEADAELG